MESIWLGCLALHLCPRVNFPSIQQFSLEILLGLVDKNKELYVFLALEECHFQFQFMDVKRGI